MGFQFPERLKNYIDNTKYRVPFVTFANSANYYAQLNYQWQDYMLQIVQPCIAYAGGFCDGINNSQLSAATGLALARGATRLIVSDRVFFNGDNEASHFLSDIWAPQTNFPRALHRMVSFMLAGGSSVVKINQDARGRNTLSAFRIDRTQFSHL